MAGNESLSVLVVDDEAESRYSIGLVLQMAGHRVEEADNGQSALAWLRDDRAFDLLILDYQMPGLNGLDLLVRLREEGRRLPTLVVTGAADRDAMFQLLQLDVVSIIRKPFTPDELMEMVGALCQAPTRVTKRVADAYSSTDDPLGIMRRDDRLIVSLPLDPTPAEARAIERYLDNLLAAPVAMVELDCGAVTGFAPDLVAEVMWIAHHLGQQERTPRLVLSRVADALARCIRASGIDVECQLSIEDDVILPKGSA